jgi:hypothetical protein
MDEYVKVYGTLINHKQSKAIDYRYVKEKQSCILNLIYNVNNHMPGSRPRQYSQNQCTHLSLMNRIL